jgi:hypothetical protein
MFLDPALATGEDVKKREDRMNKNKFECTAKGANRENGYLSPSRSALGRAFFFEICRLKK